MMTVIAIPFFLLLVALVITAAVMIVRYLSRQDANTVMAVCFVGGGVGVAMVLLLGVSLSRQSVDVQVAESRTADIRSSTIAETLPAEQESVVWADGTLDSFRATVYPTEASAIRALAHQIDDAIRYNDLLPLSQDGTNYVVPQKIIITADNLSNFPPDEAMQLFGDELRTTGMDVPFTRIHGDGESSVELGANELHLRLFSDGRHDEPAPWDNRKRRLSGKIACELQSSRNNATVRLEYAGTPWVEAFDQFVMAHPKGRFIVGYSGRLVSSEAEARRLAVQDAKLKSHMVTHDGVRVVADESHVVDYFVQKLSRNYGTVWREAVLMDVSDHRMEAAVAAATSTIRVQESRHTSVIVSAGLLFGVTIALCVVLNLLSQGYYRKHLWLGGAAAIGLIVLALMVVRMGIGMQVASRAEQPTPSFRTNDVSTGTLAF